MISKRTTNIDAEVIQSEVISDSDKLLGLINSLDKTLEEYYSDKLIISPILSRSLVSFQANKKKSAYRWFKYKEAFSADLVHYLFSSYGIKEGKILDPFAGIGTSLFAASEQSIDADGIELLPIGQEIIHTRFKLQTNFTDNDLVKLQRWITTKPWKLSTVKTPFTHLQITKDAYPEETQNAIECFLGALQMEDSKIQDVLKFALLCILESVSYTRKDGQYLRWDYRSGRRQGNRPFNKGIIYEFDQAICSKIEDIISDISRKETQPELYTDGTDLHQNKGRIQLFNGSCLNILPTLPANEYDAVITSPPYCNRYDYTRTYALELALLGVNENYIKELRQAMVSCTVENRKKDLLNINPNWTMGTEAAHKQSLLQAIIQFLELQKSEKTLNNNGIPRMVSGYFYEMACVIQECARVLKPGGLFFMVNDNVRYVGASISIDMILSNIAENIGFEVDKILVLPNGKGNSSQQMGEHGRSVLRKCVYVWRKKDE